MVTLQSLLTEISYEELARMVSQKGYKDIGREEMTLIRNKMLDPNTTDEQKQKMIDRIVKGTMRYIFTWYKEMGAERRGVSFDDFVDLSNEALARAADKMDWTRPNQYNTFARKVLQNLVNNWVSKEMRRKQVSIDKPIGSDKEGNVKTVGDTISNEMEAQQRIDDMMDNEIFTKRLKELQAGIKNPVHKYVLRWTTDPRYQDLTAQEIGSVIGQITGKVPTIQGLNGIRAKFRTEILPKLMRGL